ncbi:unnamed protein product [Dibothriocephalus latus]|uniref:Phosphatidylinositol-3-phosphatase SAC1 n=1 Tax=Dibothriocephalus latus TaxID=60516 RepID=A0A3P7L642_DIBLA|nr:unnamed protein product [Dibothriocephalus latus]
MLQKYTKFTWWLEVPKWMTTCQADTDQVIIAERDESVWGRLSQQVRRHLTLIKTDYEQPVPNDVSAKPSTIYGILGTIRLLSGRYLLTVDKRELVGKLFGHKIYRALECSVHPFAKSTSNLNEEEMEIETTYVEMLKHVLGIEGFYFSHTYDLTLTQQRLSELGPDAKRQNLFERAERRFVWNGFLLDDWCGLVSAALNAPPVYAWPKLGSFITPVIFGFVEILQPTTPSTAYAPEDKPCYALISRRSVFRAGTRFYARGVDKDANAANTVETEQIVYIPTGNFFSFVQVRVASTLCNSTVNLPAMCTVYRGGRRIRGSVPLFWSQQPNLKYKPPVKMGHGKNEPANLAEVQNGKEEKDELLGQVQVAPEQVAILKQHFHEVCFTQRYGRTVAINLLDEKGMERRLCRSYALASQSVDQAELKYESFDFHRECSALKWHRLSILLDRLEPEIVAMRLVLFLFCPLSQCFVLAIYPRAL